MIKNFSQNCKSPVPVRDRAFYYRGKLFSPISGEMGDDLLRCQSGDCPDDFDDAPEDRQP